jgi:hypothetical protein
MKLGLAPFVMSEQNNSKLFAMVSYVGDMITVTIVVGGVENIYMKTI